MARPTGSEILQRVGRLLLDETYTRWTLPELVGWLNQGLRAIVLAKPDASSATVVLSLQAGTYQQLTDDGHLLLLRAVRNIVTVGSPPVGGRVVRQTERDALDASLPTWHDASGNKAKKEVRNVIYDEANPRTFYVYPPNDGNGLLEVIVSTMPATLVASGDVDTITSYATEIDLPEPYTVPLEDYILYRAFSKDSDAADSTRANQHYQAFATALGIKVQAERLSSPNRKPAAAPVNIAAPAAQ